MSVRMEQLGSHWTDFREIWHLSIFRKFVEEVEASLNYDSSGEYFACEPVNSFDLFIQPCRENQNTILC